MHAAATLFVRNSPSKRYVSEERWVKAHVTDKLAKLAKDPAAQQRMLDSLTTQEKLDAVANFEADEIAKQAMQEDRANCADKQALALHSATYAKTVRIAKVISTMLMQWPSNTERGVTHQRKRTEPHPLLVCSRP